MKKILPVLLIALLVIPFTVYATNTDDSLIDKILSLYPVSNAELLEEIAQAAKMLNKSETDIAEQIYYELKAHEPSTHLVRISKGNGSTYALDPSSKGNIYFEPAGTFGIQHGHVGMYYSSSTLVESVPSDGVRKVSLANKKVDSGARILAVKSQYASTTDKNNAANWAYSRVGKDAYSYNFATNRLTSCTGDKNCSKLVWCAYINVVDLDKDGGLGVYPTDIRDSNKVTTLKTYP